MVDIIYVGISTCTLLLTILKFVYDVLKDKKNNHS